MTEEEQKDARSLRPAQVLASTLAATTGAFLAAQLGVYGTVIGVGVMSLLSTIGTELYSRSLERTRSAARLASRARPGRGGGVPGASDVTATGGAVAGTEAPGTGNDGAGGEEPGAADGWPTAEIPVTGEQRPTGEGTRGEERAVHGQPAGDEETAGAASGSRGARLRWSLVAAGTAVSFVLAMFIVTGIETVSGSTLSGNQGSTVGNIVGETESDEEAPSDDDEDDSTDPDDLEQHDERDPGDEPTGPETDPAEPESPSGDDEPREQDPGTTEPPEDEDTAPPDEDTDDESLPGSTDPDEEP
ncbi:MAG: hypothetical protein ACOC9R_00710 [bacterium]